jgi:hypothetical protein
MKKAVDQDMILEAITQKRKWNSGGCSDLEGKAR